MMHRIRAWVLGAAMAVTPFCAFAAAPPECTDSDFAGVPETRSASYWFPGGDPPDIDSAFANLMARDEGLDGDFAGVTTIPDIYYPFDSTDSFDFDLRFVVSTDGRVRCIALAPVYGEEAIPQWNLQRRAWAESVSSWRFKPYLVDGQPSPVAARTQINEYEDPERHVPMPAGDPRDVEIVHEMRPFGYRIELHGDGRAVYSSDLPYYFLGPQAYHVAPESVAYFLAQAEEADFWSLRDVYPKHPKKPGDYESRIEITLGGVTKSVTDYGEPHSGMLMDAQGMAYGVRHWIDMDLFRWPTLATIDQLKANDFDFTSFNAGLYLLQIAGWKDVDDATVEAVMALGAPQDLYAETGWKEGPRDLLMAALHGGRSQLASRLIAGGSLKTDGEIDPEKVNRAFLLAIESGDVPTVDLIVPFHPSMTFPDRQDPAVQVSVLFALSQDALGYLKPELMIQRLLDLGADVNARAANGEALLHRVGNYDLAVVNFLLDHGADINAMDNEGRTPLVSMISEDRALLLLERGADPRVGKTPEELRKRVGNWPHVKAWLLVHGYGDVLVAPESASIPPRTGK